jgi:hypothetical protein
MIPCSCGHSARHKELRSKTVLTLLGPVKLSRPYYLCEHCSEGHCPLDAELGIADLESSPRRPAHGSGGRQRDAVRLRMRADEGARWPRRPGQSHRARRGGHWPTDRSSRRAGTWPRQATRPARYHPTEHSENVVLMDGVQVPVVRKETEGRAGRVEGQPARTRECKLGCVSLRPVWIRMDGPFATRIPPPTWALSLGTKPR